LLDDIDNITMGKPGAAIGTHEHRRCRSSRLMMDLESIASDDGNVPRP
jgi:hypothetical protein